ncbi:unnamed protein product [Closterium sp. NIES-64]|nr:unnamed protein product [Closterium sp. NIES-64]
MAGRIRVLNVVAAVAIVVILYYVGRPLYWEMEARLQEYREGLSDATAAGTTGTAAQGGTIRPVGNARGAVRVSRLPGWVEAAAREGVAKAACAPLLNALHTHAAHPLYSHTFFSHPLWSHTLSPAICLPLSPVSPCPLSPPVPCLPLSPVYPCPLSPPVPCLPLSPVSPCPLSPPVPCLPLSPVSPCPLSPPVPCLPLSPVSPCPLSPPVPCLPLSPVSPCPLSPPVPCLPLSPVSPCPLSPPVPCLPLSPVSPCPLYPPSPLYSHTPVARLSLAVRAGLEAAALQGLPREASMALMALDVVDPDAASPANPAAAHHVPAGPVAAAESAGATGSGGADEAGAAEGEVGATEETGASGAAGAAGAGGKEETPGAAGVSLDLPSDAPAATAPALGTTAGEVDAGATSTDSSGAGASGAGPFANGVRPILHEGRPLLAALKREIWEKPPPGSAVPARAEFALRREMVEQRQREGVVVVTFANHAFLDFVLNWVRHLTDLGVHNILIGAMDTRFLEALWREGVPVFDLESGMTTDDPGWGTPVFHAMGREKVTLINVFLSLGVQLLICDTDTVWLRNPLPYMARYPQADVLTSSDHLVRSVDDESLEHWDQGESLEHWDQGESLEHWDQGESLEHWDQGESLEHWDQGESLEHWDQGHIEHRHPARLPHTPDKAVNIYLFCCCSFIVVPPPHFPPLPSPPPTPCKAGHIQHRHPAFPPHKPGGKADSASSAQGAYNIGILHFRPTDPAKRFARAWAEQLALDAKVWDQNGFNDLMRQKLGPDVNPDAHDHVFWAFDGSLKLGILPVALFCSGHTYFVQHLYRRVGVEPYAMHATFQFAGTNGKRHRFREAMAFIDPPEYYDPPGGVLSFVNNIPEELLTGGDHSLQTHFSLVNYQLVNLRAALAIATILNRALVLPATWVRYDRIWFPHPGILDGTDTPQPFLAPADHVVEVQKMLPGALKDDEFGPAVPIREYSFLDNPRTPQAVLKSKLAVQLCDEGSPDCPSTPDGPTDTIRMKKNTRQNELKAVLSRYSDIKWIEFSSMVDSFGGWDDKAMERKFRWRLRQYVGIWCCVNAQPGHIWYDFFNDEIPGWKPRPPANWTEDHPPWGKDQPGVL